MRLFRDDSIISEFVIDRLALGMLPRIIVEEAKSKVNIALSLEDIRAFAETYEKEVAKRKSELLQEIKNSRPSIRQELRSLVEELKQGLVMAKEAGNMSSYASVSGALRLAMESLAKMDEELQEEKKLSDAEILDQNNIDWIEYMEEKGILKIYDKEKLKKMLTVGDCVS